MINTNSEVHIVDGKKIFHPEFVGKFMIYLHTKFHWPISSNSLAQLSL